MPISSLPYNNMCRPLNDPSYYDAFNSWDTIYTDVAMQEPSVLRGGCTSVPEIVSPKCSAVTGENFSATACMIFENCKTMQERCGYQCNILSLIGQRIQRIDEDVFRDSNSTMLRNIDTLFISKNSLSFIADGAFEDYDGLRMLYLPDNLIESLSSGVFDGIRDTLIAMDLSVNSIRDLRFLSEGPEFETLYLLTIHSNLIDDLPSLAFVKLPMLYFLLITANPIREIHQHAFQGTMMTEVALRGLGLERIDEEAFSNSNLRSIDLRFNNIEYLHPDAFANVSLSDAEGCVDFPGTLSTTRFDI